MAAVTNERTIEKYNGVISVNENGGRVTGGIIRNGEK